MTDSRLDHPSLGYLVVTVALVLGMLTVTVIGQDSVHSPTATTTTGQVTAVNQPGSGIDTTDSGRQTEANKDAARQEITTGRRWILGVRAKPTFTGCVIQEVIPGGAADKAKLAVGDRILTVNGCQAGWVDAQRTPLSRLVDQSKRPQANLLIQKASNGRLAVAKVRLQTIAESLGH